MSQREDRIKNKIRARSVEEIQEEIGILRARVDYTPELDWFLDLLAAGADSAVIAERVGRPVAAVLCLQAPLELFHACGVHPFKVFGGSQTSPRLSGPSLPAVMCPMLRSALGLLMLNRDGSASAPAADSDWAGWVIPTTCDWVVKFPEMMSACGCPITSPVHMMELPHLKDRPGGQSRWLEEVYALRDFLVSLSGKKPDRKQLLASMQVYQEAWSAFSELTELKREGRLPALWFSIITNAFFYDNVECWTEHTRAVSAKFKSAEPAGKGVFLAGSPIFFPNLKILHLLEDAGLNPVADDLCSSERLFPGAVFCDDPSEHGMLKAMAQRYHQGCLCPTFADNDRRVNNIISPANKGLFGGVVFQVLKGCHPFDLESLSLEQRLKGEGLKYIKLETDYTAEDSQNLLTRLEAYRSTLD